MSANRGELRQNPQHGRNKPPEFRYALTEAQLISRPKECFDLEEETLP
jgi:hypothetical protein